MISLVLRSACREDYEDFANLVILSAPYFDFVFGPDARGVLHSLFTMSSNLFSFSHTIFAEIDGVRAGMILSYGWREKRKESVRTGFLLLKKMKLEFFRKLPLFLKMNGVIGKVRFGEYYISNVAVYPQWRHRGIGKKLILEVEKRAKMCGAIKVALEVETENTPAVGFYKKLGYSVVKTLSFSLADGRTLRFYRMEKSL